MPLSFSDRTKSNKSVNLIRQFITSRKPSLVFFIGAGVSASGGTEMPGTPALIHNLLLSIASQFARPGLSGTIFENTMIDTSNRLGFEITLNDLRQICSDAVDNFFIELARLEGAYSPNRAHIFLARWLHRGGIVITTNYDRMIERAYSKLYYRSFKSINYPLIVRYKETGTNSFRTWRRDLIHGGVLFKLHGSLDDPTTCLGALEHVHLELQGDRANLLSTIVSSRPICFAGWRGADPDIPPVLANGTKTSSPTSPVFWVHFHGNPRGSRGLDQALADISPSLRRLAAENPILADVDSLLGRANLWIGSSLPKKLIVKPSILNFAKAINGCVPSGLARFLGICLRRASYFSTANIALLLANDIASTNAEKAAVIQELALLRWARDSGHDKTQAITLVEEAKRFLRPGNDLLSSLKADFGHLSMTIDLLPTRPWTIVAIPFITREYRIHISQLEKKNNSMESVALHKALLDLFIGKLRFRLFDWLPYFPNHLGDWILAPFNSARLYIDDAKEIHIHSRIDVLSYRCIALSKLHHCVEARKDIADIDRLISILGDERRTAYWATQRSTILSCCPDEP